MDILKDVINNISINGKLEISKFGLFQNKIYNKLDSYKPFDKAISCITVYPQNNSEDIYLISFGFLDNQIRIKEAEELLGEYHTAYNWRDYFTRFTFDGIQNEFIESIYFEKNNEIIVDKEKRIYIEDDHSGNVTMHDYSELSFDGFVIQYR